ncbi:MAG: hypothetical protein RLO04_10825 [Limnobacter sp.]|uniref:hypothetical protein n=1 Tax=Limnobacter sp. TaxID=2003368 RepID=UPI0032EF9F79
MKNFIQPGLLVLLIAGACPAPSIAQTIANPLIRPSALAESKDPSPGASPSGATQVNANESDPEDVKRQAARRITQEDLNIQQQALNSPVVPLALVNLFTNMQVTAYFQNAIVMRKISNEVVQTQVVAASPTGSSGTNNTASQEAQAVAVRNVSRSTAVIRLRVGQVVNVAGYSVRAKVTGQDVTVDWLSERGVWVNVFYGALESSHGGVVQVPGDSQLLKVETEAFDHLVPKLNTQAFSSNTPGGNQQGNSGSPFGGGSQGFGQPGFGSSAPF